MTLHVLVAVTFLVQSIVIGFHVPLHTRFAGIRTFLYSALVLAAGSLVLVIQMRFPPGPLTLVSNILLLWGAALQYLALSRLLERPVQGWLLWGWTGLVTGLLGVAAWEGAPAPFFLLRELGPLPLLLAAVWSIFRADTRGFRTGAFLTALPFAGYAVRSGLRFVGTLVDPGLSGPNNNDAFDALAFFVFSFLWTSGFLLMVNQRLQTALIELATIDSLTHCLNRRAMTEKLEEEQRRFERYGRRYTIVLLDLDRFKNINDTRGHHEGDRVLIRLAAILSQSLRSGDSLARWGGEEFLILLPETEEAEGAALAERMRLLIEGHAFDLPGRDVTFSGGVASIAAGETVDDLCRRADEALYKAKETRNRIVRSL